MKQEVFDSIIKYIQKTLLEKEVGVGEGTVKDAMIWIDDVEELQATCRYEQWLAEQVNNRKSKKKEKPVVSAEMQEAWKKWWNLWPATKSVPDTQYKSGAKMRGTEAKMMEKWVNAITSGKTTVARMHYAADCYLQWGYEDSKRLGRNELQYRNSMEPWLNGEMYINYADVEMPIKTKSSEEEYNCA